MDMTTLTSQLGATGVVIYIAYKIVSKLYADMRNDSAARAKEAADREDKLMEHMNKQDNTMKDFVDNSKEQVEAIREISNTLKVMDGRVCSLEKKVDCNGKDGEE